MVVVEIEMVTIEASGASSGLRTLQNCVSEKQEMFTACRKSSFLVSWKGFIPSL